MLRCSTSLWSADLANLASEIRRVEPHSERFHLDVSDGHYVPTLLFFPDLVGALRPHASIPFDVHLMIVEPDRYVEAFREAGADVLSVHPEAGPHLHRTLRRIRELGAKAGVVLNPGTPVETVEWVLEDADLVLVMSVNPGFGGQSFMASQLAKVERLRAMIDAAGLDIVLEVDGGVTGQNARRCLDAVADALVAGTAVFRGGDYAGNIRALRGEGG